MANEKVAKLEMLDHTMYIVDLQSFKFFGEEVDIDMRALLDTGNTLISIPMKYKDKIMKIFERKGLNCEAYREANADFYQIGCKENKIEDFPDFEVQLGGVMFKIEGSKLVDRCTREYFFFGKFSCLLTLEFQSEGQEIILGKRRLFNSKGRASLRTPTLFSSWIGGKSGSASLLTRDTRS